MPLQIEIKPRERIIVGPYVIASTEKTKLTFFSDDVIMETRKLIEYEAMVDPK